MVTRTSVASLMDARANSSGAFAFLRTVVCWKDDVYYSHYGRGKSGAKERIRIIIAGPDLASLADFLQWNQKSCSVVHEVSLQLTVLLKWSRVSKIRKWKLVNTARITRVWSTGYGRIPQFGYCSVLPSWRGKWALRPACAPAPWSWNEDYGKTGVASRSRAFVALKPHINHSLVSCLFTHFLELLLAVPHEDGNHAEIVLQSICIFTKKCTNILLRRRHVQWLLLKNIQSATETHFIFQRILDKIVEAKFVINGIHPGLTR